MGARKKKYEKGEAAQYIKRGRAIKKLQLSFRQFRRLCVIKGIYPREPRNWKKAQKGTAGSGVINSVYYKKDIKFLLHEPILWTLREYKAHQKKMKNAYNRKEWDKVERLKLQKPQYSLDHIVKERYPTFLDALNDMDDALTLCCYFANIPHGQIVSVDMIALCRRLILEFQHYVIEASALRKVFISIKGYYYQAEIKGQLVTWIVQHNFAYEPQRSVDVDLKIMANFVDFYVILLGFINFRLYHSLNLQYPPQITEFTGMSTKHATREEAMKEMVAALNHKLSRTSPEMAPEEEEPELDLFHDSHDPEKIEEMKKQAQLVKQQQKLFKGFKFFVGREVPRESLVFVVRAVGGDISWDKDMFIGATFDETDETITHHIVDRPDVKNKYLSRYYVQPQWVYDCINAKRLLPVEDYFPGETLPPHLSPFSSGFEMYIPPEEQRLIDMGKGIEPGTAVDSESELDSEVEEEKEESKEDQEEADENVEEKEDEEISSKVHNEEKWKMTVTTGKVETVNQRKKQQKEKREVQKLREMMVKRKHRWLYSRLKAGKKRRKQQAQLLTQKRKFLDKQNKTEKQLQKKMEKLVGTSEES